MFGLHAGWIALVSEDAGRSRTTMKMLPKVHADVGFTVQASDQAVMLTIF